MKLTDDQKSQSLHIQVGSFLEGVGGTGRSGGVVIPSYIRSARASFQWPRFGESCQSRNPFLNQVGSVLLRLIFEMVVMRRGRNPFLNQVGSVPSTLRIPREGCGG